MGWNKTLPIGTTSVLSSTTTITGNFAAMLAFTNLEHDGVTCASNGKHRPGGVTAVYVDTKANIEALATTAACAVAWDTTKRELRYNNNGPFTYIGGFCPSGSIMIFYQDTAPTGWVIDTTKDDKLVYITKGSGLGGQTGGGVHSTGTWTRPTHVHVDSGSYLTTSTMPSHSHVTCAAAGANGTALDGHPGPQGLDSLYQDTSALAPCGAGDPHWHGTTSADAAITTWRPAAYSCIFATKN